MYHRYNLENEVIIGVSMLDPSDVDSSKSSEYVSQEVLGEFVPYEQQIEVEGEGLDVHDVVEGD